MGFKLYHEVSDFGPASWTVEQRMVAVVIALDANDQTRKSQISQGKLLCKTGLSVAGLKRALQKLAESGYDFRVAVKDDKNGNPVYAYRGHATDYLVPKVKKGAHPPRTFTDAETPLKGLTHEPPTTKELTSLPAESAIPHTRCESCGYSWFGTLRLQDDVKVCGYCFKGNRDLPRVGSMAS